MGLSIVEAVCDCNESSASSQTLKCYIATKDLLPSCKPLIKATMKTRCTFRRMIISTVVIIIILAIIYCLTISGQHVQNIGRNLRSQIQARIHEPLPRILQFRTIEIPRSETEVEVEAEVEAEAEAEPEADAEPEAEIEVDVTD